MVARVHDLFKSLNPAVTWSSPARPFGLLDQIPPRRADRPRAGEFLHPVTAKICTDFAATLEAFDGKDDHLHLLVCYPPKVAPSTLVNSLKEASSRLIRKEKFPEVTRHLWGEHFWSPSDCVVTCGRAPLKIIRKYVDQQRAPDRRMQKQARRLTPP